MYWYKTFKNNKRGRSLKLLINTGCRLLAYGKDQNGWALHLWWLNIYYDDLPF